jgi:hypothetical protein
MFIKSGFNTTIFRALRKNHRLGFGGNATRGKGKFMNTPVVQTFLSARGGQAHWQI